MKDYYYFLSVSQDASDEDIKKAYRKLSLKYHPDKNENDLFFTERFREIQEAYEVLIDKSARQDYDRNLESHQKGLRYHFPPSIKAFTASKIHAKKGEEIIVNWQTQNADVVKIVPFGLEKAYGERCFKVTEFKEGKFQILLHATNSRMHKTAVQGITITEIFDERSRDKAEELVKTKQKETLNSKKNFQATQIILIILVISIAIYLLTKIYN